MMPLEQYLNLIEQMKRKYMPSLKTFRATPWPAKITRHSVAAICLAIEVLFPGFGSVALAGTNSNHGDEPRIVDLYFFCRDSDFRLRDSRKILFQATARQVELIKQAKLPATFALQYDALMDTNYQKLLQEELPKNCEIAAWWEIPRPLVEKAGLKWRGQHEWDPVADVGFSPGYTPEERRKLVDVYMADFKSVFGYYPRTVGSWFIDEVTLAYLAGRYGIIASCNCKDQIGTDFYTLWGGYWNQAYYPSRVNAYMPAQTRAGQIDVPIFRMLGSDPIYEHGTTPGLQSLEPVYPESGGSAKWVGWFMNNLVHQPSLAFAYAQAGQENSFGWRAMKTGLTNQIAVYAAQARAGEIRVETLEQTGRWFRKKYALTPPTAVVALDDWKNEGRKTVWYDSRFYRLNVLWENNDFFIRDFHCFDENVVSPTHVDALTATSLTYETLPIMDWAFWSKSNSGADAVGMWPVLLSSDGTSAPMLPQGQPTVTELNKTSLKMEQGLKTGGTFSMICEERRLVFACLDDQGKPMRWAWKMVGGGGQNAVVQTVAVDHVGYHKAGVDYQLTVPPGLGSCHQMAGGDIQINSNDSGNLVLVPAPTGPDSTAETTHLKRQDRRD